MIRLVDIPIAKTQYDEVVTCVVRDVLNKRLSDATFSDPEERCYVRFILRNIDYVLHGKPDKLADFVSVDESFRRTHNWISVIDIGKRGWRSKKGAHAELHAFLTEAFSYKNFLKGAGGWGAHEFIQLVMSINRMKCCPYCNAEYVYAIRKLSRGGWMNKTSLDHFLPKSKFPYLGVSIYNLIPSCTRCNSGSKGSRLPVKFMLDGKCVRAEYIEIHPYLNSLHHAAAFDLKEYDRLIMDGFGAKENPKLRVRYAHSALGQQARNTVSSLHLKEVYSEIYGDEVKSIFNIGRVLKTKGYEKDRLDFLDKKGGLTRLNAKSLLLRCSLREEKIHSERMSKLTIDLANQMGLLE